jgi:hypothetical protein
MEMDPANFSFSGLEMELDLGLGVRVDNKPKANVEDKPTELNNETPRTPESDSSYTSLSPPQESPSSGGENILPPASEPVQAPRTRSPIVQTRLSFPQNKDGELGFGSLASTGSISGRTPRISREDVQRRLMRGRSIDSPVSEEQSVTEIEKEQDGDDGKRTSTMTDFDLSNAEIGTIETVVEKRNVAMSVTTPPKALPLPHPEVADDEFKFDLGQFGMGGAGMNIGEVDVDMRSALDRLMDDVAGGSPNLSVHAGRNGKGKETKVDAATEGIQTGRFEADDSIGTESEEDEGQSQERALGTTMGIGRPHLGRASTEPDLFTSTGASRTASGSTIPPPPPPKDAIRSREELILEKRREARRREEDESLGYYTPPRPSDRALRRRRSRRRSRSTGDVEELARKGAGLLDISGLEAEEEEDLGDSIQRELRKLGGERNVSIFAHC